MAGERHGHGMLCVNRPKVTRGFAQIVVAESRTVARRTHPPRNTRILYKYLPSLWLPKLHCTWPLNLMEA
jgi:hypothetical protein